MQGKCDRHEAGAVAKSDRMRQRVSRRGLQRKVVSGQLAANILAVAGGLVVAGGAQAADLPSLKAAPVEYVRICDAYGAGFFYIPGTDTCLRVGGLVLAETRAFNPSYAVLGAFFYGTGAAAPATGLIPGAGTYTNQRSRDAYGYAALGRIELDSRTQTGYGTLRTFMRADAYFGSSGNASLGSLGLAGGNV